VSTSGANPSWVGSLPPSAWPDRDVLTIAHAFGATGTSSGVDAYVDLMIDNQGQVGVFGPRPQTLANYRFLSLESIGYQQSSAGPRR
jgi:hypothetical protein